MIVKALVALLANEDVDEERFFALADRLDDWMGRVRAKPPEEPTEKNEPVNDGQRRTRRMTSRSKLSAEDSAIVDLIGAGLTRWAIARTPRPVRVVGAADRAPALHRVRLLDA